MRVGILVIIGSLSLAACKPKDRGAADTTATADTLGTATMQPIAGVTAVVHDASNRELGTLALTESAEGITVAGKLVGLAPGEHAIHIHSVGQCEAPFTTAGPHWNPTTKQHGKDNPAGSHFGDMANIVVGADSTVEIHSVTPGGTLTGMNALLDSDGAAVVVHAKPDDYRTDPAGNAGDRIACGVVTSK